MVAPSLLSLPSSMFLGLSVGKNVADSKLPYRRPGDAAGKEAQSEIMWENPRSKDQQPILSMVAVGAGTSSDLTVTRESWWGCRPSLQRHGEADSLAR